MCRCLRVWLAPPNEGGQSGCAVYIFGRILGFFNGLEGKYLRNWALNMNRIQRKHNFFLKKIPAMMQNFSIIIQMFLFFSLWFVCAVGLETTSAGLRRNMDFQRWGWSLGNWLLKWPSSHWMGPPCILSPLTMVHNLIKSVQQKKRPSFIHSGQQQRWRVQEWRGTRPRGAACWVHCEGMCRCAAGCLFYNVPPCLML